jgi:hypothetical protein
VFEKLTARPETVEQRRIDAKGKPEPLAVYVL